MKISLSKYIGRAFAPSKQSAGPQETKTTGEDVAAPSSPVAQEDAVDLTAEEAKPDGLLTKAGKAILDPVVGFAKRTTVDTLTSAALSTAVAAATVGAMAVAGPIGLLVPVAAGTAVGLASRGTVKKAFKNKKDARFQALGNGVAVAGMAYGALIGGPTLAGVSALAAGTGAIVGLGNTLMVQTMEATGVLNKA